jgi:hypothetical protein
MTGEVLTTVVAPEDGHVSFSDRMWLRRPSNRKKTHVGMELHPHESFAVILAGDPWGPAPLHIGCDRHAEVVELLCRDGEKVVRGQPVAVIEERDPTFEEYEALLDRYLNIASELRGLRSEISTLGGALRAFRRLRRERRHKGTGT